MPRKQVAEPDRLVSAKEAAEYLGVHPNSVTRYRLKRGLPFRIVGGNIRYSLRELDEWSRQGTGV